MHVNSNKSIKDIEHCYLEGAAKLRPDISRHEPTLHHWLWTDWRLICSLGKKLHPDLAIQGIGRRQEPLKAAQKRGIIDDYALDINTSKIQTTDIIVIASPIAYSQ